MIKYITILFILVFRLAIFSQTAREIILKTNDLIDNKKYETAYKLLDDFDPNNGNTEIVLLKEYIALNYYVKTMYHQLFAFKNMDDNDNIDELRIKQGSFQMHAFKIDKVLDSLITIYPDNCNLYKGLGDFYYEAQLRYDGKWLKTDNELFDLIEKNYTKAIEKGCGDYLSYYILGYINIAKEKYKESIPYLIQSIKLDKDYTSSYYNLAFAYLNTDDYRNAIKNAILSLDQYTDTAYKSDAARMLGEIYFKQKDDKNSIKYYELANKIEPNTYDNLNPLLESYVRTANSKAKKTMETFYNLQPDNPTIYNDLEDIYFSNSKIDDLISFYKEQLDIKKNEPIVTGNLNFYLGRIYLDKDKIAARDYFQKSKDDFSKVLSPDDSVFKVIEEEIKNTDKN